MSAASPSSCTPARATGTSSATTSPCSSSRTRFETVETGGKRRARPASFADHYSQARQFFASQTALEQKHIGDAIVFELSKVERPDIRERVVASLGNIDSELAATVADKLGLDSVPAPLTPAREPITDLATSPALSILGNPRPTTFSGRKMGILVTDGTDAAIVTALTRALTSAGATWEVIAPKVGGATLSDGSKVLAQQKVGGGPSVLYDAVAILPSEAGAALLAADAQAKDFVNDAFAHCKFIGHSRAASVLFDATGITTLIDEGFVSITKPAAAKAFVATCDALRFWAREANTMVL